MGEENRERRGRVVVLTDRMGAWQTLQEWHGMEWRTWPRARPTEVVGNEISGDGERLVLRLRSLNI